MAAEGREPASGGGDARSRSTPQMAIYDAIERVWLPYLMFFQPPDLELDVLHTDRYGFRVTWTPDGPIRDLEVADRAVDLLVGGSTAFGVGATSDRHTLPSILSESTDGCWLNFGGRAFFGTQELLLFMAHHRKLPRIRRVVLFSGLNNLVIFRLSHRYSPELGSFFGANAFYAALQTADEPLARRFLRRMMRPSFGPEVNDPTLGVRELLAMLFGWRQSAIPESGEGEPSPGSERHLADLLSTIERDLANWQMLCEARGIQLDYVLQPYADWIDRPLHARERELFDELDRLDPDWQRIRAMGLSRDHHRHYAAALGEICHRHGMGFYDMNDLLSERDLGDQWLFVDRVHLTDEGHRRVAAVMREEMGL